MASANTDPAASSSGTPLVMLSALTLLAGAGGMAVSFLFLASRNQLDVIAGAAGFLAGTILVAAGLLALAVQGQSPTSSQSAVHVVGCFGALLPPLAAALAWPVLYFTAFLAGMMMMPFVMFACIIWALVASESVAAHFSALCGWSDKGFLRVVVFILQVLGILASWPLFGEFLGMLEAMGYKIGWS